MSSAYVEWRNRTQAQQEKREAVSALVYDLLKEKNVSITDAFEILEITKRRIMDAEQMAPLP
jgi:hypothetical protein